MSVRRCIYTNREAKAKDSVLSKGAFPDLIHNWCNSAPVSEEYKTKKQGTTSELEMVANELFHMIEMHELRVNFYKSKLSEIQLILEADLANDLLHKESKKEIKKENQSRNMIILKDVSEDLESSLREFLSNRLESFRDITDGLTLDVEEEQEKLIPIILDVKKEEVVQVEIKPKTITRKKTIKETEEIDTKEETDDIWSE